MKSIPDRVSSSNLTHLYETSMKSYYE